MFDEPHDPACDDSTADEEDKAEGPEPDHHARLRALGDAKDDRSEESKEEDGSKVGNVHERFLPVASECASTAAMILSRPATTMNLVP